METLTPWSPVFAETLRALGWRRGDFSKPFRRYIWNEEGERCEFLIRAWQKKGLVLNSILIESDRVFVHLLRRKASGAQESYCSYCSSDHLPQDLEARLIALARGFVTLPTVMLKEMEMSGEEPEVVEVFRVYAPPNNRDAVYMAIDEERDYQDKTWPSSSTAERTVGEHIVLLQQYVTLAIEQWTTQIGDVAALHQIRKVAAIAVRCMEKHGAVRRN